MLHFVILFVLFRCAFHFSILFYRLFSFVFSYVRMPIKYLNYNIVCIDVCYVFEYLKTESNIINTCVFNASNAYS